MAEFQWGDRVWVTSDYDNTSDGVGSILSIDDGEYVILLDTGKKYTANEDELSPIGIYMNRAVYKPIRAQDVKHGMWFRGMLVHKDAKWNAFTGEWEIEVTRGDAFLIRNWEAIVHVWTDESVQEYKKHHGL